MKGPFVGVLLGIVFVAALFALSYYAPPKPRGIAPDKAAAEVERGFVGIKMIGPWQLLCLTSPEVITAPPAQTPPAPAAANKQSAPAPAAPRAISLGRCRTTLEYRQKNTKGIFAALSFRLAGRANRLLMIVRLPVIAKPGDDVVLRLGREGLKLKVAGCQKAGCMAAGALGEDSQAGLLSSSRAQLILPPRPDGQRVALPVPLQGLGPAITAMRRAEM